MGLSAHDVWFSYTQDAAILAGVNFRIEPGEVVGLYGPSGVGKSTLGRIMAGLLKPTRGQVLLGAESVRGPAPAVQYLVQDPASGMNPRWRVEEVLAEAGPGGEATLAREASLVDTDWLHRRPHEISGGQLQRVSLARALRANPSFLIADEITASLDAVTQVQVWGEVLAAARERGIGVLAISHDQALLARIGDRLEVLAG